VGYRTLVAEEKDRSLRKGRRQIDETACISAVQSDAERQKDKNLHGHIMLRGDGICGS
jgi:hypothetical protein